MKELQMEREQDLSHNFRKLVLAARREWPIEERGEAGCWLGRHCTIEMRGDVGQDEHGGPGVRRGRLGMCFGVKYQNLCLDVIWSERKGRMEEACRFQA